jgi:hypothetical protein
VTNTQSNTQFNQFHRKLGIYDALGDDVAEDVGIGEMISFAETFGCKSRIICAGLSG